MMVPIGKPEAALDPFGFFVALFIIVNVISAFARRARQARMNAQPQGTPAADAMRRSVADVAAAREAQRARLAQAMQAAKARRQFQAPQPAFSVAQAPAVARAPAPQPPAPQPEALPAFDYSQEIFVPLVPMVPSVAAQTAIGTLPVLGAKLTGMQLFVAAAIVGPPAALRSVGHTPAGW